MVSGEVTMFNGNKAGQRGSRGMLGVLYMQEGPRGENQSEGAGRRSKRGGTKVT